MSLPIVSKIRALVPPAAIIDTPSRETKNVHYGGIEARLAKAPDPGDASVFISVAVDRKLADRYHRYLVKMDVPQALGHHDSMRIERLYHGDDHSDAAASFRAAAWLIGAPYERHGGWTEKFGRAAAVATHGVSREEVALLPLEGVVALEHAAASGFDVRSLLHHRVESWGTHVRWLLITVLASSMDDLIGIGRALGAPPRLLGYVNYGLFVLNRRT